MTPECNDVALPFRGLCRVIDQHSANDVVGPLLARALWGFIILAVVIIGGRLARRVTLRAMRRTGVDQQLRTLVNNVFMATTIVVGIFAGITAGGVSATYLLTFGGVASLAVGLAFQDLLRNVLAGIFLLVERPFRIGDVITVGQLTGTVQTIELRTTALRTVDGRLAIMPNLSAFNEAVINSSAFDARRFSVLVRLPPDADLEAAMRAARRELEATRALAEQPAPRVQPSVEAEGYVCLTCVYWLDYRVEDPDAVAADLVGRLHVATTVAAAGEAARPARRRAAEAGS